VKVARRPPVWKKHSRSARSFPRARAELRKDDTRKSRSPLRPPFPRECGADNEQYCQWEQYCLPGILRLIATTRRQAPPRATAKFAAGDLTSIAKSDAGDSREPREEGEPTLGLAILAKNFFLLFLPYVLYFCFLLFIFDLFFILQLCILFVTYKVKEHGI
jgi:hypothetical protein